MVHSGDAGEFSFLSKPSVSCPESSALGGCTHADPSPTEDPAIPSSPLQGPLLKKMYWGGLEKLNYCSHQSISARRIYFRKCFYLMCFKYITAWELELTHSTYGSSQCVTQLLLRPVFTVA